MAKTVLRVRLDGVAFYMNTETSSPGTGHRNRFRLFKTENYGRDKSGWIQVGSTAGQELLAIEDESTLLKACEKAIRQQKAPPLRPTWSDTRQIRQVGGRSLSHQEVSANNVLHRPVMTPWPSQLHCPPKRPRLASSERQLPPRTWACAGKNLTRPFDLTSANSPLGNRALASTGSNWISGQIPGLSPWQLKSKPMRTTICPAVGAKEQNNGAKNDVGPLPEERDLAHRQSRPR